MCTPFCTLARRATPSRDPLDALLCQRLAVQIDQDPDVPRVTRAAQRLTEPQCERHVANPAALGRRDVALPFGSSHAQATLREIHVLLFQCHHLTRRSPACLTPETAQFWRSHCGPGRWADFPKFLA